MPPFAAAVPTSPETSAAMPSTTGPTSTSTHARLRLVPYTPAVGSTATGPSQTPSLRFTPMERSIPPNLIVKVGRYTDRHARDPARPADANTDVEALRFKSKVVSRLHAELWYERGELYIRDTASSSGTFLNQARLSPQNIRSNPVRIRDGDCLQLGVEYRGGEQEIFRCVRMRVELNRSNTDNPTYRNAALAAVMGPLLPQPLLEGVSADNAAEESGHGETLPRVTALGKARGAGIPSAGSGNSIADCCICLLPLRRTTLLVTPCAHCYHFSCIRPLLRVKTRGGVVEEADGFTCPICRAYVDLLAEPEELDEEEIAEMERVAAIASVAAATASAAAAASSAADAASSAATAAAVVAATLSPGGTSPEDVSAGMTEGGSVSGGGSALPAEPIWEADPLRPSPVATPPVSADVDADADADADGTSDTTPSPQSARPHPLTLVQTPLGTEGGDSGSAMTPPSTGGLFPSSYILRSPSQTEGRRDSKDGDDRTDGEENGGEGTSVPPRPVPADAGEGPSA